MAPYHIHRMIQDLLRDGAAARAFAQDPRPVFDRYGVTAAEAAALEAQTIDSMGRLGVHPNLQMKYLRLRKAPAAGGAAPGPLDAYLDRLRRPDMGKVVGAFGMSHVMFAPDGVEEQAEAVLDGMMAVRRRVASLRPDRLVLVGGDHFNNFNLALQIPLALAVSDRFRTLGDGGLPSTEFDGDRGFAEALARFAADADFDLVQAEEIIPDHGMAFPKLVVDPVNAVPTVLLFVNSGMPLPPSPRRCHALGMILRDFIEKMRPADERVVIIGLGGMSHWLRLPGEGRIAETFDLGFLDTLEQGRAAAFAENHSSADIVAAAGNGGLELLAWLVAAGAADGSRGERLFYEPIGKWITGMAAIDLLPRPQEGRVDMNSSASAQPIRSIVIVGAGIAGVRTALTLRESGFEGRIQLLSDERHAPYDRPPLSKAVLVDPESHTRIGLDPDQQLDLGGVELLMGVRCVSIDGAGRTVALADGTVLPYDRLVLATGSSVRAIDAFPPDTPGVHYLRTLDDALALKQAIGTTRRIAVVGAGVIGLEVAASLVSQGHAVTVLDPASRVMMRSASVPLGQFLERRHRAEGVDVRLGTVVESAVSADGGFALTLSDGSTLRADLIVVGVGVLPNDALGKSGGLETGPGGVVVDAQGRTSDPAIYAAGEVAFHFNEHLGRHDRQETWAHAAAHGEHVARAILGADDGYCERSSYWTDQYDINVQVIGQPIGERDIVRGDLDSGSGLIFHLEGDRIAGVSAINAVRDMRTARKLVGLRIEDPSRLADLATDLKALI